MEYELIDIMIIGGLAIAIIKFIISVFISSPFQRYTYYEKVDKSKIPFKRWLICFENSYIFRSGKEAKEKIKKVKQKGFKKVSARHVYKTHYLEEINQAERTARIELGDFIRFS